LRKESGFIVSSLRFCSILAFEALHSSCGVLYFGAQNPSILELVGMGVWFTVVFALFCAIWYQWAETG
jgi:hypothetical protein